MKRYQVFLSSTYQDLKDERKEVIQALLELDCIPVGMELFPATDDDQWTLIKELILECDYYILIVGGRYGSLSKTGISYTQMEYEFALDSNIPTISFLHEAPDNLPVSRTDKDPTKLEKLESFKALVSKKLVKFWHSPEDLGSVVSRSLTKLIKSKPRLGWVRANRISSDQANLEILELRKRIQELEEVQLDTESINLKNLAQGADILELAYLYRSGSSKEALRGRVTMTWNELFSKTCTVLLDEAKEEDFKLQVNKYISFLRKDKRPRQRDINIIIDDLKSIIIQFKALGLLERSLRKRSIKDRGTYWMLTKKGDALLTNLRAIRREGV